MTSSRKHTLNGQDPFTKMAGTEEKKETKEDKKKEEPTDGGVAADDDDYVVVKGKRFKKKKRMPPIADLLAYGAEETRGQPKTYMEIIGGPLILALLFFITLVIFHHAVPYTSGRKPTYGMNQRRRPPSIAKHEQRVVVDEQTEL